MQVIIDEDQWLVPMYSFSEKKDGPGRRCEIPEEKVKEWQEITAAFVRIQDEMWRMYNAPIIDKLLKSTEVPREARQ